jgi:hypothetical protein
LGKVGYGEVRQVGFGEVGCGTVWYGQVWQVGLGEVG